MQYQPPGIFKKLHLKEVLAVLFILLGIYFFRQERHELGSILPALKRANHYWITAGIGLTGIYIMLQAGMYVFSFAAVKSKLPWLLAVELFLKRNFISVFLPAGGVTSLAFLPDNLSRYGLYKKEVNRASGIYAFIGIFSLFLIGLPVIIYTLTQSKHFKNAVPGIIILALLLAVSVIVVYSIKNKGWIHRVLVKKFPPIEKKIDELVLFDLSFYNFSLTTLFSVLIEFSGILHLIIAMVAVGVSPSLEAACVGYVVSVILLTTSPLLRGLGVIEVSLTYILTLYGYSPSEALTITILYRIFEFWLPLAAGLIAFAAKGKQLFLRLAPVILIFLSGVINILSAITAPIASRMRLLQEYLPLQLIHASNLLVLLMGLLLLVTATFLVRGLRNAWIIALTVSAIALVTHLTKALDWEESALSFLAIVILLITHKQYRLKSNPKLIQVGVITAAGLFIGVVIFETIGFYFLEAKHFGIDFDWKQSIGFSARSFLLISNERLQPVTRFGKEFIGLVNVLSASTWIFFFYTIIRPYIRKTSNLSNTLEEAQSLLAQYGFNAADYFKLSEDKLFFFNESRDGFLAYGVANGFAIVLDEPVCADENKIPMLNAFSMYCRRLGLKTAYYRVDECSLGYFETLKMKKILIGQEAVMDIENFSLEGKNKKALRNSLNSLAKKGYSITTFVAPLPDLLVEQLRLVSDEWLATFDKSETIFSQGMFDERSLQYQDVIMALNPENVPVAFLNIIPDYTPGGFTYDMIRQTTNAPGGCIDALVIAAIEYGKEKKLLQLNLGLAPMSGIDTPCSPAERLVKFAYEKIKHFQHYHGLRDFKEKYATGWLNKYLLYENDFDLIQLPAALNRVMLPPKK